MYNFFVNVENKNGDCYYIEGSDYNHIKNVLRMREGDVFLVSCQNASDLCRIKGFDGDCVVVEILEKDFKNTNLPINIYLFQGLPKSDKMELIIQKAVELGVHTVVPVSMKRCVVKLDDKKKNSKRERWQSIAHAAAKQSKCSFVPQVNDVLTYGEALKLAQTLDLVLVPYENKEGMTATLDALKKIKRGMNVGIIIGSEGGFEENEIEKAIAIGALPISLGARILRTETAAITAMSMCMLYSEINL